MSKNIPSIKKNFAYKSLLTVSNYLMAFITFPYISRILGVENIGLVNFVDNTINYFLLFATMGVSILGVREIARVKDKYEERSRVFSNIIGVNILFTFLTLIIYGVIISVIQQFKEYSSLLYIGAAKILFSTFLIEWFYTGIESFKYITFRSITIKTLYVLSVFLCIKESDDYKLYFYLTVGVTLINALINIFYARNFVKIQVSELFNLRYLKENIILGIYSIMTSMYLTFNVMYLGLITNNTQVGYYTTAFKLYSVILGFFSAFTNVMLPRMSALIANKEEGRFNELLNKSFSTMVLFSVPLILCSIILAPQIIYILSGPGFEGAIIPMRIIMPSILFVGIAQILAVQILMPLEKDKILLNTSLIGASISIIVNILVVKHLYSIGSSIVLLLSEFTVTASYLLYLYTKTTIRFNWSNLFKSLFLAIPSATLCYVVPQFITNIYASFLISSFGAIAIWVGLNVIFGKQKGIV